MKKICLLLIVLFVVSLPLLGGGLYVYYKSLTHYPQFYSALLKIEDKQLDEGNKSTLIEAANLINQVKKGQPWTLELTQDQLNGWLEKGCYGQFPGLLPDGTYYPRVQLEDDRIYYAQEYCPDNFESVVWAQVCVQMPEPGVVCVILEKARMGLLPISSSLVKSDLQKRIKKWNLPLELSTNNQGQLQLTVRLKEIDSNNDWKVDPTVYKGRKLSLETLDIRQGRIRISGTSEKLPLNQR